MSVVANTSPLRYLIATGHADLLAKLFGTVLIPPAVERELLDPHAPPSVRQWMTERPTWLEIRRVQAEPDTELTEQLHAGEAEAVQLALELQAEVLIIDERQGRHMASARGISVIGALGMLRESFGRGFIQDPMLLVAQLRSNGFRASRALIRRFEEQIRELDRRRPQRSSGSQS